jgi:hypothetical protein
VAGRRPHFEPHPPEIDDLAVAELPNREIGRRRFAVADRGSRTRRELEVAGDEVGVEVSLDDVFDLQPRVSGVGDVSRDIALGVDDDRSLGRVVPDEV